MRHKKTLMIALCISFVFGNGFNFEVYASEKNEVPSTTIEYKNYSDILETIPSEENLTMYLNSFEKVGDYYQAVYVNTTLGADTANEGISPQIVVSAPKQVTKTYSNFDSIPSSISYEEYNSGYNTWMKGTLFLKKAEQLGTTWYAVFEGTLTGTM